VLRTHLGDLVPPRNRRVVRKRPERFRKQTRLEVCVCYLQNLKLVVHRVCEPVAIPLLPHTVHKLAYGVAKRQNFSGLTVNDGPTELCLDAVILSDERVVERLFDEDCSELTVRHGAILAVLWVLMTSVRYPRLFLSDVHRGEAYRVYNLLSRRLEITDDVLH